MKKKYKDIEKRVRSLKKMTVPLLSSVVVKSIYISILIPLFLPTIQILSKLP